MPQQITTDNAVVARILGATAIVEAIIAKTAGPGEDLADFAVRQFPRIYQAMGGNVRSSE